MDLTPYPTFSPTPEEHSNHSEASLSHLDPALLNKLQCHLQINGPVIEHFSGRSLIYSRNKIFFKLK